MRRKRESAARSRQDARAAPEHAPNGRAGILGLVLAAGVALLVCGAALINYQRETRHARHLLEARARVVLTAAENIAVGHLRRGNYHDVYLGELFEHLAETPGIVGIALRAQDGRVLASAGAGPGEGGSAGWQDGRYVAERLLHPPPPPPPPGGGAMRLGFQGAGPPGDRPPGFGMGRQLRLWRDLAPEDAVRGPRPGSGWRPLPPGPLGLRIVLEASGEGGARGNRLTLAAGLVLGLASGGLTGWALWARARQATLRAALTESRARAEQHARLAQLGAGLAHETKNPLSLVRGLAQTLADNTRYPEARDTALRIVDEADRAAGQINGFLALSRPLEPRAAPVDLDAFFGGFLPVLQPEAAHAGVTVAYEPRGLRVLADPELLRRAALNLLLNAIAACGRHGVVQVRASADSSDSASLWIRDSGTGIAAADLPHIFEPYFSRSGRGTGLGLTQVQHIAEAHGWRVAVESEPGKGTAMGLTGMRRVE